MKYFKMDEFSCPCCGGGMLIVDDLLLKMLDSARGLANTSFKINSGYRCAKHNKSVGGKATSSHCKGLAVDISVTTSTKRFAIVEALMEVGFKRIGVGKTFVHVDIDKSKAQEVYWVY